MEIFLKVVLLGGSGDEIAYLIWKFIGGKFNPQSFNSLSVQFIKKKQFKLLINQ